MLHVDVHNTHDMICWNAGIRQGEGGSYEGGRQQWGPGDGGGSVQRRHGALGCHHVRPPQWPSLSGLVPRQAFKHSHALQ